MPTTATSYQLQFKDRKAKNFSVYTSGTDLLFIRSMQDKFRRIGYKTRIMQVDVTFTEIQ